MYPFYGGFGHHMHHFHRGPSRIFWFFLGGLTTAWWIKHKEMRNHEGWMRHCVRKPIQQAPQQEQDQSSLPPPQAAAPQPNGNVTYPNRNGHNQWGGWNGEQRGWGAQRGYEAPPPKPVNLPFGWSNEEWEAEKGKMWEMGRQAGDAMSDLSESTLDNVLTTVESLKAKLAEHRAEREAQRKAYEKQMEEQKKEPRHYV